jgi:hypothetical protein
VLVLPEAVETCEFALGVSMAGGFNVACGVFMTDGLSLAPSRWRLGTAASMARCPCAQVVLLAASA